MIDLQKFYQNNSSGYYLRFKPTLCRETSYQLYDPVEIIKEFRDICKPTMSMNEMEKYENFNSRFLLLCFWLHKNGFTIKEFPNLLSRPSSLREFAYDDIRQFLQKRNNYSDKIPWSDRRELLDNIEISSDKKFQSIPDPIEKKIRIISTRAADFDSMTIEERLVLLSGLIENLLKKNEKHISLDYDKIFFGYLSEDDVVNFRKTIHCFRHGTDEMLQKRKAIGLQEKELLSDIGVFMAIHIYRYISSKS